MDQPEQPSLHHFNEGPAHGVGEVERSPIGDTGHRVTGMYKTPSPLRYENVNEALFEEGIDSDGELGSIADEFSDNEEPLPSRQTQGTSQDGPREPRSTEIPPLPPNGTHGPGQQSSTPNPPTLTLEAVETLKVDEMRKELKNLGLNIRGNKPELLERLKKAVQDGVRPVVQSNRAPAPSGFDENCYWELMPFEPNHIVEESRNIEGIEFRPPTVSADAVGGSVKLYNVIGEIDRLPFTAEASVPKIRANGARHIVNGEQIYEKKVIEDTTINMDFVKEHELGPNSHPADWFEAFIPKKKSRHGYFSIEQCTSWTNFKAQAICNAGEGGLMYPDFKPFTVDEIMQFLGLFLLNGLAPSPTLEAKFKCQADDPVFGNDFVHRAFGNNAERRLRMFKNFFSCCEPTYTKPDKTKYPNYKVEPLLKHAMEVSKKAVILGRNLSVDEQTMGFQGKHEDKMRISYKNEGDGFQCDAICSKGYTYTFYFRNQSPPKKYLDMGLSDTHSRVMSMIEQLPHKNYTLTMDNLYTSAKLAKAAFLAPQKVMINGVVRLDKRGVPDIVKQIEVSNKDELAKVRNTLKVATLKQADVGLNLVVASVYDQKPVYLMSSCCTEVKWIKKERSVYHKTLKQKVKVPFYRLNLIDFYNNNMGSVDVADQLRTNYRVDHWMRNTKWWWAIFWWCFQMLLTNAYLAYVNFMKMHRLKPMSHKDFIKAVALAWLGDDSGWPRGSKVVFDFAQGLASDFNSESGKKRARESTVSDLSSSGKKRGRNENATFSEKSFNSGELKARRLNANMRHLPVPSLLNDPYCQLCHNFGRRNRKQIMSCPDCNVALCLNCYSPFHKDQELSDPHLISAAQTAEV
jgi:hypothetical protein